ncbi:hypothetical protein AE1304_03890 [Aeromonas enteropelogenes]
MAGRASYDCPTPYCNAKAEPQRYCNVRGFTVDWQRHGGQDGSFSHGFSQLLASCVKGVTARISAQHK